jgi:hypothetical protein
MMPLSAREVELAGFVAAVLTTAAFAPQLLPGLQPRSARELSTFSRGALPGLVRGISLRSIADDCV